MGRLSSVLSKKISETKRHTQSQDVFIEEVIEEFKKNNELHRQFIFDYLHQRISNYFNNKKDALIPIELEVDELIPKSTRKMVLLDMEEKIDLIMPKMGVSGKNVLLTLFIFIFPLPIFLIIWNLLPGVFNFLIIEFPGLLIIIYILIVGLLIGFIFPSTLETRDLPKVKNLEDFINIILDQNIYMFWVNDYNRTKELLVFYWHNSE